MNPNCNLNTGFEKVNYDSNEIIKNHLLLPPQSSCSRLPVIKLRWGKNRDRTINMYLVSWLETVVWKHNFIHILTFYWFRMMTLLLTREMENNKTKTNKLQRQNWWKQDLFGDIKVIFSDAQLLKLSAAHQMSKLCYREVTFNLELYL